MTTGLRRLSRASRIGKRIGSLLSTGSSIALGYVWAKHGIAVALELWAAILVVTLAAYGACKFPWGSHE